MLEIIKEYKNELVTMILFVIVWFKDKIKSTLKNNKKETIQKTNIINSVNSISKNLDQQKDENLKREKKINKISQSIYNLEQKHDKRLDMLESKEAENKILRKFCKDGINSIHNLERGLDTITETVKGIKIGIGKEKELTDMKIKLAKYENN